jgi:hypoxanthine phosphoribosyltransferase
MGMTVIDKDTRLEVLVSAEEIAKKVAELGARISADYEGERLLLVGVLKGAAVFLGDLLREIKGQVTYDFVAISSYGSDTKSSGVVRLLKDLDASVKGEHVLVVEDIIDTGLTLSYLLNVLRAREPASLKVCALLDKPSRRAKEVPIDYRGFSIPDRFVVGYGLDLSERYRNLPYVAVLQGGAQKPGAP